MRLRIPTPSIGTSQRAPTEAHASPKKPNWRHRLALTAAALCVAAGASPALAQLSPLHASGRNIVNSSGTVVPLRGVNLGGLFVMEQWMAPLDSGFTPNDTYGVMNWLANTYGVDTEQSLISTYQNSWIQASDLDNIKNAGFNVIRVPVWWGQFFRINAPPSTSTWRSDAFTYLDWLVSNAGARGIYVIIDMHGAVGSHSNSDDTGQQNVNQYWYNGNDQSLTNWMWQQIASHYNGNSTVAGYDLLNEPVNPPSDNAVISAYASIYNAVRSSDPDHMVFIEGTFDGWNWSMLPDPSSMGWTNVVYSMHAYSSDQSVAGVKAQADQQVNDFNNHANYNVPGYVGEFTAWDTGSTGWQYMVNAYNNAGLSWSLWSYKARAGGGWGFYSLNKNPPIPNIYSDSTSTIANDWQQWTTSNAFSLNPALGGINGGGVNTGAGGGGGGGGSGSTINSNTWYNVKNQGNGLCIDATGWGTSNGTTVQQYTCGSQQYNQEWQFQSQGNGVYSIVNRNAPSQVLDIANIGTSDGSLLQTWTNGGGSNQQWTVSATGNGNYTIVGVGSGKCIDVPGSTTSLSARLQIWGCDGTPAQYWSLVAQP